MPEIFIHDEEEAWSLLAQALENPNLLDEGTNVHFEGWPNFTIYHDAADAEISGGLMRGLLEFQSSIYQSYALVEHGRADARLLTDDERKKLELKVRVRRGSTDASTNTIDLAQALANAALNQMTPTHTFIVAMTCIVVAASGWAFKAWLDNNLKKVERETLSEERQRELDIQERMADLNEQALAQNARLVERVVAQNEEIERVRKTADDARDEFAKHVPREADVVRISGVRVDPASVHKLPRAVRTARRYNELEDIFHVRALGDRTHKGRKLVLRPVNGEEDLPARIADAALDEMLIDLLSRAYWDRQPVRCTLQLYQSENRIYDARVKNVQEVG